MQGMAVTLALLLLLGVAVAYIDCIHMWSLRRLRQAVRVLVPGARLVAAGDGAQLPRLCDDGRSFLYLSPVSDLRLLVTELDCDCGCFFVCWRTV
jgi:hypothetical protein